MKEQQSVNDTKDVNFYETGFANKEKEKTQKRSKEIKAAQLFKNS
jgi:hypothetical protein